jgi:hypothetical protein
MGSGPRAEPYAEGWVEGPFSPPWPWTFLSLRIATTRLPRAAMSADTARDTRPNRSATSGPLAPGEWKSQVRRTCRTRDRDARQSRSAFAPAVAGMPFPLFPGSAPIVCAADSVSGAPALGSPTDRFALVDSPARRFPAALRGPACRACSPVTHSDCAARNQAGRSPLRD